MREWKNLDEMQAQPPTRGTLAAPHWGREATDTSRHCGQETRDGARPESLLRWRDTPVPGAQRREGLGKVPAGIEADAVSLRGLERGEESSDPLADDGDESEVKAEHIDPMDTSDRHDIGRRSRSRSPA
jgi:hypothetical protein